MMDWKDIGIRAMKTFAQAFFAVLIPALVTYLNGGWPESWDAAWVALSPALAAALAAAISAVWNALKGYLELKSAAPSEDDGKGDDD